MLTSRFRETPYFEQRDPEDDTQAAQQDEHEQFFQWLKPQAEQQDEHEQFFQSLKPQAEPGQFFGDELLYKELTELHQSKHPNPTKAQLPLRSKSEALEKPQYEKEQLPVQFADTARAVTSITDQARAELEAACRKRKRNNICPKKFLFTSKRKLLLQQLIHVYDTLPLEGYDNFPSIYKVYNYRTKEKFTQDTVKEQIKSLPLGENVPQPEFPITPDPFKWHSWSKRRMKYLQELSMLTPPNDIQTLYKLYCLSFDPEYQGCPLKNNLMRKLTSY